jgi:hypothetical protein
MFSLDAYFSNSVKAYVALSISWDDFKGTELLL